eukprot:TRINITY_DN105979_c0_g1_i1.p1 TRINITY_DN105979_c0_g1~~TRINITY_DN105979_c0_g1_i1.p1  ORF type:complete len:203 (-),score=42.08 TRINITY_DN105979_c0_g1_i1:93-701(-)
MALAVQGDLKVIDSIEKFFGSFAINVDKPTLERAMQYLTKVEEKIGKVMEEFRVNGNFPVHPNTLIAIMFYSAKEVEEECNAADLMNPIREGTGPPKTFSLCFNYSRKLTLQMLPRAERKPDTVTHGKPDQRIFHVYISFDTDLKKCRVWKPKQVLDGEETNGLPLQALACWDLFLKPGIQVEELELMQKFKEEFGLEADWL